MMRSGRGYGAVGGMLTDGELAYAFQAFCDAEGFLAVVIVNHDSQRGGKVTRAKRSVIMAYFNNAMSFAQLTACYGRDMAFDLLAVIEKMALIVPDGVAADAEVRLQKALALIDASQDDEDGGALMGCAFRALSILHPLPLSIIIPTHAGRAFAAA